MKALDTNILIRFLVNDDHEQAQKVLSCFEEAEDKKQYYFVSTPVVLEMLWVLRISYNFSKEDVISALEALLAMPVLRFEKAETLFNVIHDGKNSSLDLADILIAYSAKSEGCESILTFDKKAGKHHLFEPL